MQTFEITWSGGTITPELLYGLLGTYFMTMRIEQGKLEVVEVKEKE